MNATGEGDADNYIQRLESLRNRKVGKLLNDLDQVLVRSTLGSIPEGYKWSWPPIEKMNELEEAQIAKLQSEVDVAYLAAGVITEDIVADRLLSEGWYNGIDQEYVDALKSAIEAPMDEGDQA